MRTPYGKQNSEKDREYTDPYALAAAGYNVLVQDVRGTGRSEGVLIATGEREPDDGYDTVEWAAEQPWSDGSVGMIGLSYFGYTQLAAASTRPPHLKAICPFEALGMRPFGISKAMTVGVFHLTWLHGRALERLAFSNQPEEEKQRIKKQLEDCLANMDQLLLHLPLRETPAAHVDGVPQLLDFVNLLDHADDPAFWSKARRPLDFANMDVAMLHLSGWYDMAKEHTIENYLAALSKGTTEKMKKGQKLILGPWVHGGTLSSVIDGVDFGPEADSEAYGVAEISRRWYDCWLKGMDNGIAEEAPVSIFVMGDNVWREEKEWPLARTEYTELYLHSTGAANSLIHDGTLDGRPPEKEKADEYRYDPADPVPSTVADPSGARTIQDQTPNEERGDVLVYTGAILDRDLEVTGKVVLRLFAATDAVDTDFTCVLTDVHPDGKAYNLTSGIVRARYRNSMTAEPVEPGRVYEYDIDTGYISNVFKAGHRIRIQVSSSLYPEHDRNLNTGEPLGSGKTMHKAKQTVYHDAEYPSKLILPVIPRA
jgi:putative CocE/NonD family hydrolase